MSNKRAPLFTYDEMRDEILPKITSLPEAQKYNRNSITFGVSAASLVLLTSYEAARAKDAELIQMLIDALDVACTYAATYEDAPFVEGDKAIEAAADAGFKPSDR